ncbi:MAG: amino acid permease [Myxococcota bacterium]|jgi:APA family basic amino acid/polyamine antiporter|nr:amino acid permease [Myxococcota bacterium]
MSDPQRELGVRTAALLVVASMIGTGVFTTTGFLVRDVGSAPAVLVAWLVGGVAALCGALAYGELAAALPNNGGEYALLSRVYHPSLGLVAGLVSFVVGFAAPAAASAIAFGVYLRGVFPALTELHATVASLALLVGAGALHLLSARGGRGVQDATTALKVALLVVFVALGLPRGDVSRLSASTQPFTDAIFGAPFAAGLVYVAYAYTGWNAAAYVAGETRDPGRNVPRALALGTAVVTLVYLALNATFLAAAPADALSGRLEVGEIAARALFGDAGARLVSAVIAWGLVSNVGAFLFAGPRILEAIGRDVPRLSSLSKRRAGGGPIASTLILLALALAMALSASFDALLLYVGVLLSLFAGLTAAGVFVLRRREPELPRPYRAFGHPWTTLVFLALTTWMIVHATIERPTVAAWAAATLALGLVLAWWLRRAS